MELTCELGAIIFGYHMSDINHNCDGYLVEKINERKAGNNDEIVSAYTKTFKH